MYQLDKQAFGSFVASLRKQKNMTQKELAQKLFLSDKAVSKWERGQSIPDPSVLVPLAECLDVTVTELLRCKKEEKSAPMELSEVEQLVRTVAEVDEQGPRAFRQKSHWFWIFPLSAVVFAVSLLAYLRFGEPDETLVSGYVLPALAFGFGLYFCYFAPLRLSRMYDEYELCCFMDGCFRMNLPGMRFCNSNWPYILKGCRIWCCAVLAGYVPVLWLLLQFLPPLAALLGILVPVLLSLFGIVYFMGKRHL